MVEENTKFPGSTVILETAAPSLDILQAASQHETRKKIFQLDYGNKDKAIPEYEDKDETDYAPLLKKSLINALKQISDGYKLTIWMYLATFAAGIILLFISVALYWFKGDSLLTLVFVGVSVVDLMAFFLRDPIKDLKKSKCDLVQLEACLYHWFIDLNNWNDYLKELENNKKLDYDSLKRVSDIMYQNTGKTVKVIQRYADDCELKPPV